jgi:hypothetical protein
MSTAGFQPHRYNLEIHQGDVGLQSAVVPKVPSTSREASPTASGAPDKVSFNCSCWKLPQPRWGSTEPRDERIYESTALCFIDIEHFEGLSG